MSVKRVVVDPHAHFYGCFDPALFFESVLKNLEYLSKPFYGEGATIIKAIFLTEGSGYDYYSSFRQGAIIGRERRYTFEEVEEGEGLILRDQSEESCYIFPGRQIITSERLELLSLASTETISDGMGIGLTIENLLDKKIITVIPWGVGKWMGRRKRVVMDTIEGFNSPYLLLADSAGRPVFWGLPAPLKHGFKRGVNIINGSDPFPLPMDNQRAGTAGFTTLGDWDDRFPVKSIRNLLLSPEGKFTSLGKRDTLMEFIIRQLLLKKRAQTAKAL